jgi:hypothetical protein
LHLTFFLLPLSQAYPGATAVLVDEIDAGRLKSTPYDLKSRTTWLAKVRGEWSLVTMAWNMKSGCLRSALPEPPRMRVAYPVMATRPSQSARLHDLRQDLPHDLRENPHLRVNRNSSPTGC